MTPSGELIRREILAEGPMRFDRFQELALYGPGGFYERAGRVGMRGDFVTGSSWDPAFGRCLARLVRALSSELGEPIDVLDAGCGEGEALSFLHAGLAKGPRARLLGLERSAVRRSLAQARLPGLTLFADTGKLPNPLRGLIFAYELFDALPVRALRVGARGTLRERWVVVRADEFAFAERPVPDGEEIRARLSSAGVRLEPRQCFEIRPGAAAMARILAERLSAGLLLVFDYGAPARALYGPTRRAGTLEAFVNQSVTRDVLTDPGGRDITAWVDFTELEAVFRTCGLEVRGLISQSRALMSLGIVEELNQEVPGETGAERAVRRNAIAKLFMPGGMGESIRVLVTERGTTSGASLLRLPPV